MAEETAPESQDTPLELMEKAYEQARDALAAELLERLKQAPPKFFERVVIDLMVAMGYGGSHADAAESLGGSGDEGVDGVIREDRLGLDVIYLQAKRWDGSVRSGGVRVPARDQ